MMQNARVVLLLLALVAALASVNATSNDAATSNASSTVCILESLVLIPGNEIDDEEPVLSLLQYLDVPDDDDNNETSAANAGVITVQLTYKGQGWLGFGFNRNGEMVGSTVVMGEPIEPTAFANDNETTTASAYRYFLAAKTLDSIQRSDTPDREVELNATGLGDAPATSPPTAMPTPAPTKRLVPSSRPGDWRRVLKDPELSPEYAHRVLSISDATVQQNGTHTILRFSRPLTEDNHTATVAVHPDSFNTFIYAVGSSNSFGYHIHRGSRTIQSNSSSCIQDQGQSEMNITLSSSTFDAGNATISISKSMEDAGGTRHRQLRSKTQTMENN
jgi:hypothetical protein